MNKRLSVILAVIAAIFATSISSHLFAAQPSAMSVPEAAPIIRIQNATILTSSHGTIEHGSILIKDGKIAEVGGDSLKAPKAAQVIDANGQVVMTGIIH